MLNNLLPCSKQSLYEDVNIKPPSSMQEQSRSSEIYELPQYQISSHCLPSTYNSTSKVCVLASITNKNQLQINHQALQIISNYSKFELIYCGVYGGKSSGKSTFIDHFLKLDLDRDKGFKAQGKKSVAQSLIMNTEPISIGPNKKLWLIEYSKGFQSNQLKEGSQKLLDLLIFLSNSLVIMVNKSEVLKTISRHIQTSAQRLKFNPTSIYFWPENLYIINTYTTLSREADDFHQYFRRTALILWIKGESKPLSNFLTDIGSTSDTKSIKTIANNFHITKKLILRLEIQENLILNGSSSLPIERMLAEIHQELCNEYLVYHHELYDSTLQQYFIDERPYQIDYLIQSFEKCRETIVAHFKEHHIAKDSSEASLQQLEDFIDQRERLIVEVNKKKSQFELKKEMAQMSTFKHRLPKAKEVQSAMNSLRSLNGRLQHAGVQLYAATLYEMIKNIEKGHKKLNKKQEEHYANTINALQAQIHTSKEQLKTLRVNGSESMGKKKEIQSKSAFLQDRLVKLKKQLDIQRKNYKQIFNERLTSQEKADKLLGIIRELEEKVRQNAKIKTDIEKEYDFNPEIERLQRQLEKLERNMNGESSKLENALNSQIDPQMKTESKITIDNKLPKK